MESAAEWTMARNAEGSRKTLSGRKQFLVYVDPALIKDIKRIALERDESTSAVVEEAMRQYLDRNKVGSTKGRAKKSP